MPGPIRDALKRLVAEVIAEQKTSQAAVSDPEQGTVATVNDDGSVNVQTNNNLYPSVGAATTDVQVVGKLVMVISGDGRRVAVPR